MRDALVIGFGNPLRGDDGAGHHVIAALLERRPELACLALHQLALDLAQDAAESAKVIFVDASVRVPSVTVRRIEAEDRSVASHHLAPEAVLSAAEVLYGARPPAWLVEVPAFALDHGDTLSPGAAAAVREAIAQVEALLDIGRDATAARPRRDPPHGT